MKKKEVCGDNLSKSFKYCNDVSTFRLVFFKLVVTKAYNNCRNMTKKLN